MHTSSRKVVLGCVEDAKSPDTTPRRGRSKKGSPSKTPKAGGANTESMLSPGKRTRPATTTKLKISEAPSPVNDDTLVSPTKKTRKDQCLSKPEPTTDDREIDSLADKLGQTELQTPGRRSTKRGAGKQCNPGKVKSPRDSVKARSPRDSGKAVEAVIDQLAAAALQTPQAKGKAKTSAVRAREASLLSPAKSAAHSNESGVDSRSTETQSYLRKRLLEVNSQEASELELRPGLQTVHDDLLRMLSSTVEQQHNNVSVLVMGDHGVGKTVVVERAVASLCAKYNTEDDRLVGVVRLTGQLHCEERAAFQEIARQLCGEFSQVFSRTASYDENLVFLRGMLSSLHRCLKTVVFILDEFERFAVGKSKQVLLYNLLDVLQTANVQAAVVGLTRRQDIHEAMEKRVRSRFSHRKIYVMAPTSLDEGPDCQLRVLEAMLSLPSSSCLDAKYVQRHNQLVQQAVGQAHVKEAVSKLYEARPSDLVCVALSSVAAWQAQNVTHISSNHLISGAQAVYAKYTSQADMVAGQSVLQLFLLAAAHRLETKGKSMFNFEMVFDEYRSCQEGLEQLRFGPHLAWPAFQHLVGTGLLAYINTHPESRGPLLRFAGCQLRVSANDIAAGLVRHGSVPPLVSRFFKQEV